MEYVSCLMYVVLHACRGCCVQLMFLELAEGIWGLSCGGRKYSYVWRLLVEHGFVYEF